jgi:hypothetical protein
VLHNHVENLATLKAPTGANENSPAGTAAGKLAHQYESRKGRLKITLLNKNPDTNPHPYPSPKGETTWPTDCLACWFCASR